MDSRQLEIDRMFKKKGRGPLLESCQVKKLSKAMFEGNNKFQESTKESNESREIPAGYTYFFQLISHDIVPSTTETNSRVVTPELSLDSIYGQGEHGFSPELFNGQGQFIHRNSLDFDVWREQSSHSPRNYIANIPEQRNDENLIVVQLHRLLQKFHNIVVQSIQENEPTKKILKAKEYVVAIFQTIVIEDALDKVLHPCIHKYFFKDNGSFYYQITSEFKIPYEFSHAAFRFGHSMVRSQYLLNNSNEEPTGLRNIFW